MRLIATRRMQAGSELGRDVMDGRPGAIPLLRAGVKLTERHRDALLSAGVNAVYIRDALSEGIDVKEVVDPETRLKATAAVSKAFDGARQCFESGRGIPEAVIGDLTKVA